MQLEFFLKITNILVNFVEAAFVYKYILVHSQFKEGKNNKLAVILWCLTGGALVAIFNTDRFSPAGSILVFLEILLFGWIYLKNSMYNVIWLFVSAYLIIACIDMSVGVVYTIIVGADQWNAVVNSFVVRGLLTILTKVLLVAFAVTYFRNYKKKRIVRGGNIKEWSVTVVCFLLNVIFSKLMLETEDNRLMAAVLIISIIMLALNVFLANLLNTMQIVNEEKLYYQMDLQQSNLEQNHFLESKKLYNSLREARHDLKHHVAYMEYLLKEEEYKRLEGYLEELIQNQGCKN